MFTRHVMTMALMAALLMSLVLVVTASAAPPTQGESPTLTGQTQTIKFLGTTKFAETRRAPINDNLAIDLNARANRAIPGKTRATAPNASVPVVPPLPVSLAFGGRTNKGLNGYDNRAANGFNVTPPDQGLCASPKYVVEAVNVVLAVYDTNFNRLTGNMSLEPFFGYSLGNFNVGDPKCYFDPATQRFFLTVYDSDFSTYAQVDIAVSMTDDPRLGWYLYAVDTTENGQPNCPCFGDQPLLGANRDALFISTNQYGDSTGFDGANLYVIDKHALSVGAVPSYVNVELFRLGLTFPGPNPNSSCVRSGGSWCWYSLQPATSPAPSAWDNTRGGIEYLLSSGDFIGNGDARVFLWAATNTQSIRGTGTPHVLIQEAPVRSLVYFMPPNGVQKNDGILDAGQFYYLWNPASGAGAIATNDDRMNQTEFVGSTIWGGLNTAVDQKQTNNERHSAVAYFGVKPSFTALGKLVGTMARQGYISPAHADAMFPTVTLTQGGRGLVNYSMSGRGYYPSTAYSPITTSTLANSVHVANKGMGSLDDFCEYPAAGCGGTGIARPRFGDYSAAVAIGNTIFFANEYIQYPECSLAVFSNDHTCKDTRGNRINWGTSLDRINP